VSRCRQLISEIEAACGRLKYPPRTRAPEDIPEGSPPPRSGPDQFEPLPGETDMDTLERVCWVGILKPWLLSYNDMRALSYGAFSGQSCITCQDITRTSEEMLRQAVAATTSPENARQAGWSLQSNLDPVDVPPTKQTSRAASGRSTSSQGPQAREAARPAPSRPRGGK
jgi:hypothetical protein